MKIRDLWCFFKNVPKRGHPYSVTELNYYCDEPHKFSMKWANMFHAAGSGGVKYYSSFDICSFHQREVQMGGILCGLKIIRLITPNQNEYVWYRSLIPGSVTFWYGSGSATRTLIRRVSDPDPHGSAFIWAAGSESAYKLRIRIRIKSMQIRNPADPDPEHCSFRYGTYRIVPILCIATGTLPPQFYYDDVFTLGWRSLVTVFEKLKVRQFCQKKGW